jgi:DNA-binding MarR family transcriptional regulator
MADPTDRRARLLTLTSKGMHLLARAVPVWERGHAAVEESLGQDAMRLRRNLQALA